jgi:hypothetical protein
LDPLLFNVYVNDLPSILKGLAHTILYADDITSIVSLKDITILNHNSKWFQNNQLVLNLEKMHVIKFTTPKALDYQLHIEYNDQDLNIDENVKFLGTYLDCHLKCKQYSDNLIKKFTAIFMLRELQPI